MARTRRPAARPRVAPPPGRDPPGDPDHYPNPFAVAVDQNELQHGYDYKFVGLRTNADKGSRVIAVPLVHRHLGKGHGDYQVDGLPGFAVERKSKSDLFGSVRNRENFVERLTIMVATFRVAAIVVEAEISEIRASPPPFSNFPVKSLLRTIQHWTHRFPTVHWHFLPGREVAEAWTFRLLEAHWKSGQRPEAR